MNTFTTSSTLVVLCVAFGLVFATPGCSKHEDKSASVTVDTPPSNTKKTPDTELENTIWFIPGDMTTSAGKPAVDVHIQMGSGNVTKEGVDAIVSRIRWQTYPEGEDIKFTYSWVPPHPYEIPKDTPKGQPFDTSKQTDVTGNPIGKQESDQRTSVALTPDSKLENRWYQVVLEDGEASRVKGVQNVNPNVGGKILSRFTLASVPTIQSVQICRKGQDQQKLSVKFSEPVSYETLKDGMNVTPLADGATCSFVEALHSPTQATTADYLCSGLWGDTIAAKLKPNHLLVSASSKVQVSLLNVNAKTQSELYSSPPELEVNFKNAYKENEYCLLWTPLRLG